MKITSSIKFTLFITLLATSAAFAKGSKAPPPESPSDVIWVKDLDGQKQERKMWCVGASTRMMLSAERNAIPTQCEIASRVHGENCCTKKSVKCEQPLDIKKAAEAVGYRSKALGKNFAAVVKSIKNGKPVMIAHYNNQGSMDNSAHAEVAYGTYNVKGVDYLVVFDPFYARSYFMSEAYVQGLLAWTGTYILE